MTSAARRPPPWRGQTPLKLAPSAGRTRESAFDTAAQGADACIYHDFSPMTDDGLEARVAAALGRQVVVKVLSPELGAGLNVERFRREIQLAAGLQHPHIVPLLSAGEARGERAVRERDQFLLAIGVSPHWFDPMRADARFVAGAAALGLDPTLRAPRAAR